MRNILKIFAYFISFVGVGALAAFLLFRLAYTDKKGVVPDLSGLAVEEAMQLLQERELALIVTETKQDEKMPEDQIIEQLIAPGENLPAGSEVGVIVSGEEERLAVPSFEGQNIDDVKITAGNMNLEVKKITWVHSDDVESRRIIAQRPLPGNTESREINLLVSLGPYDVLYKCPSFVNLTVEDARRLAAQLGIVLSEKDRGNKVIFQRPEAGARIKRGETVEVTLGRGWGMWF